MPNKDIDINWRGQYSSLNEFYEKEYDPEYYSFTRTEKTVDPLEPPEDIDNYNSDQQRREIAKCCMSFEYFCTKYVKIAHPKRGLVSFILYNYQRKVIKEYENNRFNILSKFRQGGLTTVTVIWAMWRCLFKLDETIMVVSKSDREAIAAGEIVKRALMELPTWMKPEMEKNNDHQKIFSETGCKLFFYTPEASRGRSITYLIIDEAAFIPSMEKHWKSLYPTISTGGHCITISTVNGVGNWYYDTFMDAKSKKNDFHIIELDYQEHPDYDDDEWVKQTRAQLGEKGWMQEVMRDFLGAGESYIDPEIINDLELLTKQIEPIKRLFPEENNHSEAKEAKDIEHWNANEKGALYIWREPVAGREYIIGADCAEGMGEDNDNNAFEIIDAMTCEQVAEFYSNICQPHKFATILSLVGHQYNTALIIVESLGSGLVVLEKLQHEFNYPNLYENEQATAVGIKTNSGTRPKFLETMQARLSNRSISIKSRRLVKELKGFIWNSKRKRAEASKHFHDDAIMALCLALYAKETSTRYSNLMATQEHVEQYKADIYEEIKREIEKTTDWTHEESNDFYVGSRDINEIRQYNARPNHDLLKEFGW